MVKVALALVVTFGIISCQGHWQSKPRVHQALLPTEIYGFGHAFTLEMPNLGYKPGQPVVTTSQTKQVEQGLIGTDHVTTNHVTREMYHSCEVQINKNESYVLSNQGHVIVVM